MTLDGLFVLGIQFWLPRPSPLIRLGRHSALALNRKGSPVAPVSGMARSLACLFFAEALLG
jgi:hypothetical protein